MCEPVLQIFQINPVPRWEEVYHLQHNCSEAANTVGDTTHALSSACINMLNSEKVNRESNVSSTNPSLEVASERRCTRLTPKLLLDS
jgi:hypothetical protein